MNEVIEFYRTQQPVYQGSHAFIKKMQQQACETLTRTGFPHRKDEAWKYTRLDNFLAQRFSRPAETQTASFQPCPLEVSAWIENGQVRINPDITLPQGVSVQPLARVLENNASLIAPYLNQILKPTHGFHALNTAMLDKGIVVHVSQDVSLSTPLVLSYRQSETAQMSNVRTLLIMESGSQACVLEWFHGKENTAYFTNAVTEIHLAARAQLTHVLLQDESRAAFHVGHLAVHQQQASQFTSHVLGTGGGLARREIQIDLQQEQAQCVMNGMYFPSGNQHQDYYTRVNHHVPNGQSTQDYKGVLMDTARGVFNGQVCVARDAQHTRAHQYNKNLLLSKGAEIDTKPQLEIFADDVVCAHGATVGQMNEEALFYLQTRGFTREEAARCLIHAFISDNIRQITHTAMADWMNTLITHSLGEYA